MNKLTALLKELDTIEYNFMERVNAAHLIAGGDGEIYDETYIAKYFSWFLSGYEEYYQSDDPVCDFRELIENFAPRDDVDIEETCWNLTYNLYIMWYILKDFCQGFEDYSVNTLKDMIRVGCIYSSYDNVEEAQNFVEIRYEKSWSCIDKLNDSLFGFSVFKKCPNLMPQRIFKQMVVECFKNS